MKCFDGGFWDEVCYPSICASLCQGFNSMWEFCFVFLVNARGC